MSAQLPNYHTLTGLSLADAIAKLDTELPPDAYSKVPGAVDLTDIDPGYMRKVLNATFGLCGQGWGYRFAPDGLQVSFGEKNVLAVLKDFAFWYRLSNGDQTETFEIPATGASDNRNAQYAMKGALTNALGNAVSNLGFQESVYLGHRSHLTVQRKNGTATTTAPASKPAPVVAAKPKPVAPPAAPAATPAFSNLNEFVVAVGKHSGKRLTEVPRETLEWYANKMATTTDVTRALAQAAQSFLTTRPVSTAA